MEKKTIEEMRVAVLAYCEEVCPNDGEVFEVVISGLDCTITGRHHHGIADFDIRETGFFKRRIYQIRSSDDGNWWHLYYIFLGLEARDAVAYGKARSFKEVDSCTLSLGKMAIRAKVAEARNTALVAALQSLKIRAWDAFNKIELAAVQKGAVGRIKRQHTPADTKENDSYIGEILDAKRAFDAQVDELIAANTEKISIETETYKEATQAELDFFNQNFDQVSNAMFRSHQVTGLVLQVNMDGTWDLYLEGDNGIKPVCIHQQFYIAIYYSKKCLTEKGGAQG